MSSTSPVPPYVLCVSNDGYEASLAVRRVYQTLVDPEAAKHGLIRVIDESGEDCLFPKDPFAAITIPKAVSRAAGHGLLAPAH